MSPSPSLSIHASTVCFNGRAVVLSGPSGSGKSELAWALCGVGAQLIGDDVVLVDPAPPFATVRGLCSRHVGARGERAPLLLAGIGRIDLPAVTDPVPIALIALCRPGHRPAHGHGDVTIETLAGRRFPAFTLDPFAVGATERIALALDRWGL